MSASSEQNKKTLNFVIFVNRIYLKASFSVKIAKKPPTKQKTTTTTTATKKPPNNQKK